MLTDQSQEFQGLTTEQQNDASQNIDCLSALEIVQLMNAEDATITSAVAAESASIAAAIERIVDRIRAGGRLIYIGAGTSGRLGVLDASECPPTFNTPPELVVGWIAGGPAALTNAIEGAEDDAESGRAAIDSLNVRSVDTIVGIAASGRTPYVLGAMTAASERGAFTVGLACNQPSQLETIVEIMIAPVVGPEVVAGSTRLKAATAQKMVLNMLSTGSMILLGKTFGHLMVDVRATNAKLRLRAIRIVQEATGLEETPAADLLRESDGDAKTAIVAARANCSPEEAWALLESAGGSVRAALGDKAPCPV